MQRVAKWNAPVIRYAPGSAQRLVPRHRLAQSPLQQWMSTSGCQASLSLAQAPIRSSLPTFRHSLPTSRSLSTAIRQTSSLRNPSRGSTSLLSRNEPYPSTFSVTRHSSQLPAAARAFHSSRRTEGHPVLFILVPLLKTSASLSVIKTIARVTLSLLPVFVIKKFKIVKWLRRTMTRKDIEDIFPGKRHMMLSHLRTVNKLILLTLLTPVILLGLTIAASMERTPLTGRMRLITLSPFEEEEIANDLHGDGWRHAIIDILTTESYDGKTPPKLVPPSDWRYQWVEQTMRRLEASILASHEANNYRQRFIEDGGASNLPPPPEYPLLPRPRASQLLHSIPSSDDHHGSHNSNKPHTHHIAPHTLLGPPYSLLIVENPDRNAFSYGFGAGGSGGVVLYTGFLDEVLACSTHQEPAPPAASSPSFFGSIFGSSPKTPAQKSAPSLESISPEQTSALATLLSHELSHLILSHHLETLSTGLFVPLIGGIVVDFARVLVFPFTFMFGPFISDALADASRLGMREMSRASEACASRELELEADKVSVRLMSLAGFDPQRAITFWEDRLNDTWALDADAVRHSGAMPAASYWSPHGPAAEDAIGPMGIGGRTTASSNASASASHPLGSERVRRLKKELERWEEEREKLRNAQVQAGEHVVHDG